MRRRRAVALRRPRGASRPVRGELPGPAWTGAGPGGACAAGASSGASGLLREAAASVERISRAIDAHVGDAAARRRVFELNAALRWPSEKEQEKGLH